jgi:hypothetical protein
MIMEIEFAVALFLASAASGGMTGEILSVAGGLG